MIPALLLDTNVLLDWLVFRDPVVRPLVEALGAGTVRWVASEPMLAEFEHVLTCAEVSDRLPERRWIDETIGRFAQRVEAVPTPWRPALRCTDADDQMFLDLALHAGARWLVTRDKALLRLARKAAPLGLAIVPPRGWARP